MSQTRQMDFLRALAGALSAQFGPGCEVAVYDLAPGGRLTVAAIENGHVTGRRVGDGPSPAVREALEEDGGRDRAGCLTRAKGGKILKSSVVFLRRGGGAVAGALELSCDITMPLMMEETLRRFTGAEAPKAEPEPVRRSVVGLLDELIEQSVALVGKPAALMTREEKVQAIRFLNEAGAFLITKSGDRVCRYFGISKYTLYSYMDEGN